MNLVDFIYKSNSASDISELVKIFLLLLSNHGIDNFMMGDLIQGDISEKEAKINCSTYPEEWMSHYLANHYVEHDPVYLNGLISRKPFTWDEIINKSGISSEALKVMGEASEFQLCGGIGASVYRPSGGIVGFGLSTSEKNNKFDKNLLTTMNLASIQFYTAYSSILNIDMADAFRMKITEREREVLHWIAAGKSKSETAEILSVSLSCVKRHCENIFFKLGTNNLPSSVAKALNMGIINPF